MGILIDLIIVGIVVLSAFLGYKKGLVELGAKLFAGIIAIILTVLLFRPIGNIIINNTQIDEKIENTILEKTTNVIDENSKISENQYIQSTANGITSQIKEKMLPKQAEEISINIVYIIVALALFIIIKIALRFVTALIDLVAKLPILKQFNEVGGLVYGIARGIIIIGFLILISAIIINLNPNSGLDKKLDESYITKYIYSTLIKF